VLAAVACMLSGGCHDIVCAGVGRFAITVDVRDSVTGAHLVDSVHVTAQDGAFQTSFVAIPDSLFGGAAERAGTYSVIVERVGYITWRRDEVRVDETRCGAPATVALTALLQRQ
jgi:hypothetical protein